MHEAIDIKGRIRIWLALFMIGLIVSGLTAFPIETQLAFIVERMIFLPEIIYEWVQTVYQAVSETNDKYPFLSYGTDWLAFAHIVIAIAFIGPFVDPVRNIWVIKFGMMACLLVIPLALIAGSVRQIPFFWRMIDCSFGIIGFAPLLICYKYSRRLEKLNSLQAVTE